jgi:FAD/FMN-containing dehydrogenase
VSRGGRATARRPAAASRGAGGGAGADGARAALAAELRARLRGEVRFDPGSLALYATDASNYRQVPLGVVIPVDVADLVETVAVARRHGVPLLARGGGTSLAGQCCNTALVVDTSKHLNRILELDPARRRARIEPGLVLDALRAAASAHGLTFGPDPSTHDHCTLGGMIGNNSCGVHSVLAEFYGPGPRTGDSVESLEVVTYDGLRLAIGPTDDATLERLIAEGGRRGAIYRGLRDLRDRYASLIRARFPRIPRRVSGYDLPQLLPENGFNVARALVGTESTCVTILHATVTLVPSPAGRALLVLGYPSVYEAGDDVPTIREHRPIGLEGLDDRLVEDMKRKGLHPRDVELLPPGRGWLLVEFGGATRREADEEARRLMARLGRRPAPPAMKLFDDPAEEKVVWTVRESGLGATARVPAARSRARSAVAGSKGARPTRRAASANAVAKASRSSGAAVASASARAAVPRPRAPPTAAPPPRRIRRRARARAARWRTGRSPDRPGARGARGPADGRRAARGAHTLGGSGGGCTTTTSQAIRVTPRTERTSSSATCRWPSWPTRPLSETQPSLQVKNSVRSRVAGWTRSAARIRAVRLRSRTSASDAAVAWKRSASSADRISRTAMSTSHRAELMTRS